MAKISIHTHTHYRNQAATLNDPNNKTALRRQTPATQTSTFHKIPLQPLPSGPSIPLAPPTSPSTKHRGPPTCVSEPVDRVGNQSGEARSLCLSRATTGVREYKEREEKRFGASQNGALCWGRRTFLRRAAGWL